MDDTHKKPTSSVLCKIDLQIGGRGGGEEKLQEDKNEPVLSPEVEQAEAAEKTTTFWASMVTHVVSLATPTLAAEEGPPISLLTLLTLQKSPTLRWRR